MISLTAGTVHATNITQGITAHAASTAALRWKCVSLERRLFQMLTSMAPNTSTASIAHTPRITMRILPYRLHGQQSAGMSSA